MAKDKFSASQANRKIVIQSPAARVDDGQGGSPNNWVDAYTCWADKQDLPHGRGLFNKYMLMQKFPQATTTFQFRFQYGMLIKPDMRVKYVAHGITHTYRLLGPPQNLNEANVSILLICQEDQAQAVN